MTTQTPTNLETLLVAIRDGRYSDQEMSDLPTFGGEGPTNTNGVWSWDATRLLCRTSQSGHHDGLGIVDRPVETIPRIPHRIMCRYVSGSGQWEDEGSGDVFDSLDAAEAAMDELWTADDEGSPLEYCAVEVRS